MFPHVALGRAAVKCRFCVDLRPFSGGHFRAIFLSFFILEILYVTPTNATVNLSKFGVPPTLATFSDVQPDRDLEEAVGRVMTG